MYNFWSLTLFEYRKLWKKKTVWISILIILLLCFIASIVNAIGDYQLGGETYDSNYNIIKTEQAYGEALSGRQIDDALLGELQEAYSKVSKDSGYTMTKEYWQYAHPYSDLYSSLRQITGDLVREQGFSADSLYKMRTQLLHEEWESMRLTEGEIAHFSEMEAGTEIPFTYKYCEGWKRLIALMYTNGVMICMLIAICIPVIFAEEHVRRTDQILITTKLGKQTLYWTKVFTGITFGLLVSLGIIIVELIPTFIIYGTAGFDAQMQLLLPLTSWDLTAGQMTLILAALLLVSSVVFSAIAMVISEKTRSNVVPMAILIALMLANLFFNIPEEYRILSQIWNGLPTAIVSIWNAFDIRLIPIGNTYLTIWQVAPWIYIVVTMIILAIGYRIYKKFQAGGR